MNLYNRRICFSVERRNVKTRQFTKNESIINLFISIQHFDNFNITKYKKNIFSIFESDFIHSVVKRCECLKQI